MKAKGESTCTKALLKRFQGKYVDINNLKGVFYDK
jgi:hypothetical protein